MQFALNGVLSALSIVTVGLYIWAARYHFTSPTLKLGAILISLLVIATAGLFVYWIWALPHPLTAQIVGGLMQGGALAIFLTAISASKKARLRAAFAEENPASLVTDGPYKYVRHPFYTSYVLFWVGWAISLWTLWAVVPVAFLVGLYISAAKGEEQKFAATDFAAEYAAYKAKTGFFWPKMFG